MNVYFNTQGYQLKNAMKDSKKERWGMGVNLNSNEYSNNTV